MSKNHPNDSIYSILGKLDALKPTAQEKHDSVVKQIRESVEAQGSILSGVDAVQSKLAQQFAEAKKSKPDFLDLDGDKNEKEPMKKAAKEKIEEKAVSQAQQKFMGMVHAAQKGSRAASPEVAKVAKTMGKKDAQDFAATKHKGLPQHVEEATCNECGMYESKCGCEKTNEDMSRAAKGYEKYGKKGMEALAKAGRDGASEKKLDTIRDKHDQYNEAEECCCKELGQKECPVHCDEEPRHGVKEAEITRTDGKTVHRKTEFPGYPADDINDLDDLRGPGAGKRGRPRKHAAKIATGLGRGRPVKATAPTYSKQADPFGRISGAVPKSKIKGRVHSMDESMSKLAERFSQINEGLNFKRMAEETHQSIDELMNELQNDIKDYKTTGHCSEKLKDFLNVHSHSKKQMADEAAMASKSIGHDLVSPEQRVAQAMPPKTGIMGAVKDVAQGAKNWIQGKPEQGPTYEEQDPLQDELNELARLAGLSTTEGNAFTGKLKDTSKGDSFELDGKTYKDTSSLDEEPEMEGNEFSGELAKARAQHKDTFDVDGKEYPVTEADAPVNKPDEDEEPVNKPKPEYKTMRQSTLNPGEGDNGEKEMHPDRPTFKNGDNALSKIREAVGTLEARLAAEYESIKKVN
jgi:hypothetical protein